MIKQQQLTIGAQSMYVSIHAQPLYDISVTLLYVFVNNIGIVVI